MLESVLILDIIPVLDEKFAFWGATFLKAHLSSNNSLSKSFEDFELHLNH